MTKLKIVNHLQGMLNQRSYSDPGPEEIHNGPFHLLDIHFRVHAGAKGSLVQDSNDRNGVSVLYSRREIQFTGYRHDHLGPVLHNDPSGQRPTGRHSDFDLILV